MEGGLRSGTGCSTTGRTGVITIEDWHSHASTCKRKSIKIHISQRKKKKKKGKAISLQA